MHDDLLTETEAARFLRRHPQTIRQQRRAGTLPFRHLKVGGRFFYRQSDLDAHLRECEVPTRRTA